ncbi:hypothetical protein OS145_11052 [Idiomarina baltica OS145]|uniref:Secreted protein n=1 Tax=Idiomarina baltica OS145 TaxID=314276 RepID=A0ABM9WLG9_9GAMM|nr:hypothetical protein OS145_11052 [Idiomarina baltica OS145]
MLLAPLVTGCARVATLHVAVHKRSCTASRREADANKACGKRSEPHPSLAAQPPSKHKDRTQPHGAKRTCTQPAASAASRTPAWRRSRHPSSKNIQKNH